MENTEVDNSGWEDRTLKKLANVFRLINASSIIPNLAKFI